jgi:gamma-glutamylcyclotransferase (GGCT)/AIG2-like uncharacterized protein YtfP
VPYFIFMQHPIFIYGTLRDPEVRRQVFGRLVTGTPDHLDGYGLAQIEVDGQPYPNIVLEDGAAVAGEVIELSDDELHRADAHETAAYARRAFVLASGKAVEAYIAA